MSTAVTGPEYSWEALVCEGDVWFSNTTAKKTTGPPHFVELTHRTAVALPDPVARQVDRLATDVLAAVRMRTGLVHLEFRLAPSGPTLIEVAVRMPGDYLMDLLGLTYGVDWLKLAVRAAMTLPLPDPPPGPVRHAASYLPITAPGRVAEVVGIAEVFAHPCVLHAAAKVAVAGVR